ncbi:DsrE family protein [Ferroplasma sp.]|uniref:DsrE family protein n=1 Tax=Ferroplasma sp. TaxID=2591003 RepID=UPI00307EBF14
MGKEDYLLTLISGNDSTRLDEAFIVATGLGAKMGAKSVTLLFIGSSIETLNKYDPRSLIVKNKLDDAKKANVKIMACPVAMDYYHITEEELLYYDCDKIPGGKVIADAAREGNTILTF